MIYYNYLTKGTLYQHLAEVDERAECMFNQLVKSLAEKENITEQLKENDILLWVKKIEKSTTQVEARKKEKRKNVSEPTKPVEETMVQTIEQTTRRKR